MQQPCFRYAVFLFMSCAHVGIVPALPLPTGSGVDDETYAAASRIESVDFAKEAAELAKNKIINQSSLAMVSQANQAQMAILGLLD